MSEPLPPDYAACNEGQTDKYTRPAIHEVTNRDGEVIQLKSALLAEHFTWAMSRPLPKED